MSTDTFEDTLRNLVHEAADAQEAAYLDLDPHVVLVRGRRVVRRRRGAVGIGAAAAAVVIGLVGFSASGTGVERTSTPAASTSSTAASSVTAVLDRFSDLAGADGRTIKVPGPQRVAVSVDRRRTPDLVFSEVRGDGSRATIGGSSLVGVGALAATWGTAGDGSHVLVGVLPAQAKTFQLVTPITDEGGHASTSVTKDLPGTGRTAFAVRFAEAADAAAVRHLLWWGVDGVVHDESGEVVPSVALGDVDGTTVFVAQSLNRMGTFSDGGGSSMMTLDAARNSSRRPVMSTARGTGGTLDGLFVAVVPAATLGDTFRPARGVTVTHLLSRLPLPGTDRAVLWAAYSTPTSTTGSGYTSVTWTEPDGRVVTQRP